MFEFCGVKKTKLTLSFLEAENYFIIDSRTLEICKKARQNRIKICKQKFETALVKGFCTSQNTCYLFCFLRFHSIDIKKANGHHIKLLKDFKNQLSNYVLLWDRGYLSTNQQ